MYSRITILCVVFMVALGSIAQAGDLERNLLPGHAPLPELTVTPANPALRSGAPETVFDYPSNDSTVVGSVGFIDGEQVGYFWSVSRGDSVTEVFAGPASIDSYTFDVDVIENALNNGAFVNWDVWINGNLVDNFTVNEGFLGTVSRSVSFPCITGPSYVVEIRVTNEVAGGEGSHSLRYAGIGFNQVDLIGPCGGGGFPKCLQFTDFCDSIQINGISGGFIDAEWFSYDCAGATCPMRGKVGISGTSPCDGSAFNAGMRGRLIDGCSGDFYWVLDSLDGTMDMIMGLPPGGSCWIDELAYMLVDGPCSIELQLFQPQVPSHK